MKEREMKIQERLTYPSLHNPIRHILRNLLTSLCWIQRTLTFYGIESDDTHDAIADIECPDDRFLQYSSRSVRHLVNMKRFFDTLKNL